MTQHSHDYHAKHAWQSPKEAAAYRQSREPGRFHRYHREEAIVREWLGDLPKGGLLLDIPCGTGRMIGLVTRSNLRYLDRKSVV